VSFLKRPELVIVLGFILISLGVMVLVVSGSSFEGGFVFVFPFFFFGNIDSLSIVSIVGFAFFIVVLFILMFDNWFNFKHPDAISEGMKTYIRYDTICTFCGEAMPKTARYCPTCGHDQENNSQLD